MADTHSFHGEQDSKLASLTAQAFMSTRRFFAMGTRIECHLIPSSEDPEALRLLHDMLLHACVKVERALGAIEPQAGVSMLNERLARDKTVALTLFGTRWVKDDLSDLLIDALGDAIDLSRLTDGLFDPVIGQVSLPHKCDARAPHKMSYHARDLRLDRLSARLFAPEIGLRLDLGGIGKGVALDHIRCLLVAHGCDNALISLGESSVLALGAHPHGAYWPLSLPDPFQPDTQALITLGLKNMSWSISSNLTQTEDGPKALSHIIDPRTQKPVIEARTALVLDQNATRAEALSTALLVAEPFERDALMARFSHSPCALFRHEGCEPLYYNGIQSWMI